MGILNETALGTASSFVLWFLVFYVYHGLGITLGYHRLLTHKSLKMPKWLMYLIVSGGYLCLMGSPIVWAGVHRLHHQKSDQEGDPHSPVVSGFKHALYEWMFDMQSVQSDVELQKQVPDLINDPIFRPLGIDHSARQATICLSVNIAVRVVIFFTLGLIPLIADVLSTFIVFWSTQLVNAVCHLEDAGYRTHTTRDGSRNVWWVGILALGEGWHNNHHAIPKSAQHGMKWYEVDLTWYFVLLFEKLGLATNVIRPPKVRRPEDEETEVKPIKLPTAQEVLMPEPVLENATT